MSLTPVNTDVLLQVNFGPYAVNQLGNIYYTIYNADGSVYLARTNTDVVALGDGQYGVTKKFPNEGNWSVYWEAEVGSNVLPAGESLVVKVIPASLQHYSGYGL